MNMYISETGKLTLYIEYCSTNVEMQAAITGGQTLDVCVVIFKGGWDGQVRLKKGAVYCSYNSSILQLHVTSTPIVNYPGDVRTKAIERDICFAMVGSVAQGSNDRT